MNAATDFVGQMIQVPKDGWQGAREWGRCIAVLTVKEEGWRDAGERLLVQFADGSTVDASPQPPSGHGWWTGVVAAGEFPGGKRRRWWTVERQKP